MKQRILLVLGAAMLIGCTSSAVRMHEAAFDGNAPRVQRYLDRGVSSNAMTRSGTASLHAAGRRPDFVAAHATSTPANDTAEHAALRVAFGSDLPDIPVTALKSRIGHTLGAAGAIELSVAIEAMERGRIPSVANAEVVGDSFPDLDLVVGEPRQVEASTAAVVSLGFGGADAAIVVESGSVAEPIVATPPKSTSSSRGA